MLDVLEKRLPWPIGYPRPFKPSSRFEVLEWTFFDKNQMYSFSDDEPTSNFPNFYYGDFSKILQTIKLTLHKQQKGPSNLQLLHGYHRVDPKRGTMIQASQFFPYFENCPVYVLYFNEMDRLSVVFSFSFPWLDYVILYLHILGYVY